MSVSAMPTAFGAAMICDLALTSLVSQDLESYSGGPAVTASASVRILRAGTVQDQPAGSYVTQNTATEWIETACKNSSVGDAYEVRLDQISKVGDGTFTGTLATWQTINTTRTWTLAVTSTFDESGVWTGTLRVRRIGDAGSEVSASVSLTILIEVL